MSIYKNDKLIYVAQCVDSLLKQTFKDFHVYVQYDGVVESGIEHFFMELNDSRFHVYGRDENYGLAYSLNELLTIVLSKGYDYVLRMDADDICLSNRFEKQIIYMNNHKNIDICGGHIEEMDENKKSIGVIRYPLSHDEMKCFFGKRNPLAHMSVIFRKSYFHKAGLYPVDTDKDEDTIFWLNGFLSGCKFANIDEVLVRVRVNKDFYLRRNGLSKSLSDLKNRCLVISKSYLVNVNYVKEFRYEKVVMDDGKEFKIGPRYKDKIRKSYIELMRIS